MALRLIDSHAHLGSKAFNRDREAAIGRARQAGVEAIVEVGTDLESSRAAVRLAREHDFVYAAVGIHPHDAGQVNAGVLSELEELARQPGVLAIGEIGLDYYRDLSPRAAQRSAFGEQLELASRLELPVILHCRDAMADLLAGMRGRSGRGVLHSYLSGFEYLDEVLGLGLFAGISGPVTFPDAEEVRRLASAIPGERLLIETDCPYLAPVPHRRERNEPAYVRHVADAVAQASGRTSEDVARSTALNARTVFGIA